jgi:hypothetical protein
MAAAAQRVERPDHSRGAGVEILERRLGIRKVSLGQLPEVLGIERRLRVRDDRANGFANALGVPRLVRQLLEVVGVKERQRALARSQTWVQNGASSR